MNDHGNTYQFIVPSDQTGVRVDRFVAGQLPDASRAQVQRAAQAEGLRADGIPVKVSHKVQAGETIEVELIRPEDSSAPPQPEDIALDIVHEDDAIIVVNKAAGMVVHPATGNRTGTLVNALLGRGVLSNAPGPPDRPGIVHRLDKGTSGLLVCARTELAHRRLAEQLKERTMTRTYLAICWGHMKSEITTFDGPIGRSIKDRKRMTVRSTGRSARTIARVSERFELADCLEVKLETGRTHQIRVHLTHSGHPIVGDPEYGGDAVHLKGIDPSRRLHARKMLAAIDHPALHAQAIRLVHPTTGEELSLSVPPPSDFQSLLELCRADG